MHGCSVFFAAESHTLKSEDYLQGQGLLLVGQEKENSARDGRDVRILLFAFPSHSGA
jgi:hypothetical protein